MDDTTSPRLEFVIAPEGPAMGALWACSTLLRDKAGLQALSISPSED